MARISVFIDGFNLYHSIVNEKFPSLAKYRWLNIAKLVEIFVSPKKHTIKIFYFTSLAEWSPNKVVKHEIFIKALESTGIKPIYGKFKLVDKKCGAICKKYYQTFEEKRTDVNIAINLFQMAEKEYDQAVILSGDSDLIPAVEAVRTIYPRKKIGVIIPINGNAVELMSYCNWHTQITQKQLATSQFQSPLNVSPTEMLICPPEWLLPLRP
jgi:uncharacterized LabA/DUF88 family protein